MINPNNREYITSAKSINRISHAIPAFLILKYKYILYKWALYNIFSDDINLSISDSGNSNDSLVIDWPKHFEKHSAKQQIKLYCLLVIDGYGLHLTYKFWFFTRKHKIILFHLLFYFIHLTQLLDVHCF